MPALPPRHIVFVLYPGVAPFDVAGPAQAFAAAGPDAYALTYVSLAGGMVAGDASLALGSVPLADVVGDIDTLVLPGGPGVFGVFRDPELVDAIRDLGGRARRVASVCVGAFLSAEAGFLAGRPATTHWKACTALAQIYPDVRVDENAVFVRDRNVWSSAGISAGVDLALALIEDDLGPAAAMVVARELVVFLRRSGGQSQFSTVLAGQSAGGGRFAELFGWISANLASDLRVEQLAERAAMTPRSFARRFQAETGQTPAKAIERMRLEAAKSMLERGEASLASVAAASGFGDEQRLRRAFLRGVHVSPAAWRQRFVAARGG
ncbi:MAG TPA: helix-turn-helix domain-containing protein [Caulobacteraceae bacterium]|jgi:transcriptional regulator GlxA family with amidase domain